MDMKIKVVFAVLLAAVGFAVRADYLLWQVDQTGVDNPIEFAFAKLVVKGEGVPENTYLEIAGSDGSTTLGHTTFPDLETGLKTKMAYADLGEYAAIGNSFIAELYSYEGESAKMVGISELVTYGQLLEAFHVYSNMSQSGVVPYTFSAFSVPEPTSGLLVLLGFGLMALCRKKSKVEVEERK